MGGRRRGVRQGLLASAPPHSASPLRTPCIPRSTYKLWLHLLCLFLCVRNPTRAASPPRALDPCCLPPPVGHPQMLTTALALTLVTLSPRGRHPQHAPAAPPPSTLSAAPHPPKARLDAPAPSAATPLPSVVCRNPLHNTHRASQGARIAAPLESSLGPSPPLRPLFLAARGSHALTPGSPASHTQLVFRERLVCCPPAAFGGERPCAHPTRPPPAPLSYAEARCGRHLHTKTRAALSAFAFCFLHELGGRAAR
ncbi:MAG: hypothetical protein J3K34DRAFT_448513 [Monoraphidium minutum]|nr:MAG: hypothetical protein J3K34DRAFT_448513 [Monoraphidium minutum]